MGVGHIEIFFSLFSHYCNYCVQIYGYIGPIFKKKNYFPFFYMINL